METQKQAKTIKKGLVLEGGAMRGLFTAGVTDVLMENGINFDGAVGVSAGAAFGCNYKSRQNGRVLRYNLKYCRDKRYCSFRSLIKTGDMFGVDFCYRELPEVLDPFDKETFSRDPMEFYVVCTDLDTGKPVYKKCETGGKEDLLWFRASASMPLVSTIVKADGKALLDGGISDSIPLRFFEGLGYEKNLVILTQPHGYVKTKNKMMPLIRHALKKYPNAVEAVKNRHEVYNSSVEYVYSAKEQGRAFVICPDEKLPVGRLSHDPEQLKRVYDIGRRKAEELLSEISVFFKENS